MVGLVGAGLIAQGVGAGLSFAGSGQRERAVERAQAAMERASSAYHRGTARRQGVLDRAFESLASQRGVSVQQMLQGRNSEARLRTSEQAREGSALNIAEAQGQLQKRLAPPDRASVPAAGSPYNDSRAVHDAQFRPDVQLLQDQVNIGAARSAEGGFDMDLRDRLGLQMAQLQDRGTGLNVNAGITEAVKQNQFNALMNQLGVKLDEAGQEGGMLRLLGGLAQKGGQLATNIGAFRGMAGGGDVSNAITAMAVSNMMHQPDTQESMFNSIPRPRSSSGGGAPSWAPQMMGPDDQY